MSNWVFKENGLDLIRLVAAMQVMVLHTFEFTLYDTTHSPFFEILRLFPGVPIFFFISGFLISKSYERSPGLISYARNRALRIYPALILCVLINLLMIGSTGYFEQVTFSEISWLFLAKVTVFQFYNPDFMRGFGDGVLNGSLWTICVELQFYVIVPILYRLFKLNSKRNLGALVALLLVFIAFNRILFLSLPEYSSQIVWKIFKVSFVPWFYMFLFGIIVQRNFKFFANLFESVNPAVMVLVYTLFACCVSFLGVDFGNGIPPYVYFPLALLVFRVAYSTTMLSNKLLNGNDISYGIYIWHMVFVNQLLFVIDEITVFLVIAVIVITVVTSLASWMLVERRMLKLKRFSVNSLRHGKLKVGR